MTFVWDHVKILILLFKSMAWLLSQRYRAITLVFALIVTTGCDFPLTYDHSSHKMRVSQEDGEDRNWPQPPVLADAKIPSAIRGITASPKPYAIRLRLTQSGPCGFPNTCVAQFVGSLLSYDRASTVLARRHWGNVPSLVCITSPKTLLGCCLPAFDIFAISTKHITHTGNTLFINGPWCTMSPSDDHEVGGINDLGAPAERVRHYELGRVLDRSLSCKPAKLYEALAAFREEIAQKMA